MTNELILLAACVLLALGWFIEWRKRPKAPCLYVPAKWTGEIRNVAMIVSPQTRTFTIRGLEESEKP